MSSNTTEPLPEVEEEEPVVRAKDKIKQFEKASTAQVNI